jgi:hypothetical protein
MNLIQKILLRVTLMFLGQKASFSFYAGKHKYQVMISYTADHQFLSFSQIEEAVASFAISPALPFSETVGNTAVTISLVA